jgi:hypothetical protein
VCVTTQGVNALMAQDRIGTDDILSMIQRHMRGDWGEVDEEDRATNDYMADNGGRVLSAYTIEGIKFWVITEADRHSTTVLLPDEY